MQFAIYVMKNIWGKPANDALLNKFTTAFNKVQAMAPLPMS